MRISQSWQEFTPRGTPSHREPIESYLIRIRLNDAYNHIPNEVFEQWIYPLHDDEQTLQNYAWLDYARLTFKIIIWDYKQLDSLHLVPRFEHMKRDFDSEFAALPPSEGPYWRVNGTWRVPPIVVQVDTLTRPYPETAYLRPPYQLVEGHSRLHNLLICHHQNFYLAAGHKIYLMRGEKII